MKIDAPETYDGRTANATTPWLIAVRRWLDLTAVPREIWYDVVATRMRGGAATWINLELEEAKGKGKLPWQRWSQFKAALIARFEPVNREERSR